MKNIVFQDYRTSKSFFIALFSILFFLFGILYVFRLCHAQSTELVDQWFQKGDRIETPEFQKVKGAHQKRIEIIVDRLTRVMPEKDSEKIGKLKIVIIDDPIMNAGVDYSTMYVSRGLLEVVKTRDQLALILAHELAHATLHHYEKTFASNIVAAGAGIGAAVVAKKVGANDDIQTIAADTAIKSIQSCFSLTLEAQADEKGLQNLYYAGFDVRKAIKVWIFFAAFLKNETGWSFARMHPPSPERIVAMERAFALILENKNLPFEREKEFAPEKNPREEELLKVEKELDDFYEARPEYYEKLIDELSLREYRNDDLWYDERMRNIRREAFGINDVGVAEKVGNFFFAKRVEGRSDKFPLHLKKIEWFVSYKPNTISTLRGVPNDPDRYVVQWYSPNGNLYNEQHFTSSMGGGNLAKTSLEWDSDLGDFLVGRWMVRVYERGYLLDERTFEIVKNS